MTGMVLEGELPRHLLREIQAWLDAHRQEVLGAWLRCMVDCSGWSLAIVDRVKEESSLHPPAHRVLRVFPLYPSYLLLEFETGEYRIADLSKDFQRDGELLVPLKQWDSFRQVRVDADHVTIEWPNGLDFDPGVLYAESKPILPQQLMS